MHELPEDPDEIRAPADKPKKPGRSTGPTSAAGKQKSSMNRLDHGCRSEKTILSDEDPVEFEATVQAWLDIYQPQDRKEDELVNEIIHAHWHLKRCKRRLEEVEFNLPGNAWNWTDEHQKLYANFSRYKTTAERSFGRWYKEMESYRGRQFREEQIREKALLAAATVDLKWLNNEEKKIPEKLWYTQVVEIGTEDGKCFTNSYPTNQEIIEQFVHAEKTPTIMKRLLVFMQGIPPEYTWTKPTAVGSENEPMATQTMLWTRWLEIIDREEASGTGHIGPLYTSRY